MPRRRKRVDWEHHIARQKKSGLTIQAYSQQEGFSSWSFYQHRKRLQQQNRLSAKSNPPPAVHSSFIPVGTLHSGLPQITIHFPDCTLVEIHALPAPEYLECILSTLQRYSEDRE
jgi:hypothetical protein